MTTENLTEILPAGGSRKPSPPCFCAVGKPDISRFLHTLAALNGEMLGVDLQVTDIRRKQDGDGKNLFVLDGAVKSFSA